MHAYFPPYRLSLLLPILSFILCPSYAQSVDPTTGLATIPCPNDSNGWCYYCSDDDAPALCNADCTVAINRLCGDDLTQALTDTEKSCEIKYLPPVWPFTRNGARPSPPSESQCIDNFNGILSDCGKDAGDPANGVNASYCTTSGGGGTFGWKDDGTVIPNSARYVVTTPNTRQCGQGKALWQQADSCSSWNDSWIGPNDQVVLDTNPPASITAAAAAAISSMPAPNPECNTEDCDIYGHPYFASSPAAPWTETSGYMRHRVVFSGWSTDPGAPEFFHSLQDRCQSDPQNWAVYPNGTDTVADFELPAGKTIAPSLFVDQVMPKDYCWCIPDAIFDASVGITLARNAFCDSTVVFSSTAEFAPASKKRRSWEGEPDEVGPSIFREVQKGKMGKRWIEE